MQHLLDDIAQGYRGHRKWDFGRASEARRRSADGPIDRSGELIVDRYSS